VPTVSVVLPTYNRAELLPGSIASILDQDFRDLELLIVDDGSTDDTFDVIENIRAQDSRLRYIRLPENRGIGFARNAGQQHVSGKYIAHADSDDLWLTGKLRAQVDALEKHPEIEILFGDFWNIDHLRGTSARAFEQKKVGMQHLLVRHLEGDLYVVDSGLEVGILRKVYVQLGTVLLRADVLRKVGGFDVTLSGAEDLDFCWRAAVLKAKFAYLDRPLVERHKFETSVTANFSTLVGQVAVVLRKCRQESMRLRRHDLLPHIHAAEHRLWRRLIRRYCERGERRRVLWAYGKSLRHGFSLRTFVFCLLGMAGSPALSTAMELRARLIRPS